MDTCRSTRVAIAFLTFSVIATLATAAPAGRCDAAAPAVATSERHALSAASVTVGDDLKVGPYGYQSAVDEMLRGGHASALAWDRVPELVVVTSVMQYEK